jgi:hypothetical protein
MMHELDYERPSPRRVAAWRVAAPRVVTKVVVVLLVLGWVGFFTLGSLVAVESHWTNRPQDFPQFQLTPWRAAGEAGAPAGRLEREAVWPLTFRTLRYRQVTEDGGAWVETVGYEADVRWGTTLVALGVSAVVPVVVYFGLRWVSR